MNSGLRNGLCGHNESVGSQEMDYVDTIVLLGRHNYVLWTHILFMKIEYYTFGKYNLLVRMSIYIYI
jgi:hypothetical protein